jgi:Raf kinase inhibitor-like YbhB/YbcL family protein
MRHSSIFAAAALFALSAPALAQAPAGAPPAARPPGLLLTSSGFTDGGILPDKFSQASPSAVTPPLSWTNVPAGTASYVLILHDADTAPRKAVADIHHWIAFNIPGTATSLPEGVPTNPQLPDGTIQPNNFARKPGYLPPAAPPQTYHHYVFELYALDTKLSLDANAARADIVAAMEGHVLGKAALVARFHLPATP